eukprot:1619637-Rhodomonas_salina.1
MHGSGGVPGGYAEQCLCTYPQNFRLPLHTSGRYKSGEDSVLRGLRLRDHDVPHVSATLGHLMSTRTTTVTRNKNTTARSWALSGRIAPRREAAGNRRAAQADALKLLSIDIKLQGFMANPCSGFAGFAELGVGMHTQQYCCPVLVLQHYFATPCCDPA